MKDETASVISAAGGGVVAIIGDHEPAQTAHPAVEQQADQGTREARVGDRPRDHGTKHRCHQQDLGRGDMDADCGHKT